MGHHQKTVGLKREWSSNLKNLRFSTGCRTKPVCQGGCASHPPTNKVFVWKSMFAKCQTIQLYLQWMFQTNTSFSILASAGHFWPSSSVRLTPSISWMNRFNIWDMDLSLVKISLHKGPCRHHHRQAIHDIPEAQDSWMFVQNPLLFSYLLSTGQLARSAVKNKRMTIMLWHMAIGSWTASV